MSSSTRVYSRPASRSQFRICAGLAERPGRLFGTGGQIDWADSTFVIYHVAGSACRRRSQKVALAEIRAHRQHRHGVGSRPDIPAQYGRHTLSMGDVDSFRGTTLVRPKPKSAPHDGHADQGGSVCSIMSLGATTSLLDPAAPQFKSRACLPASKF